MRDENLMHAGPITGEYVPVEFHRLTEEEYELGEEAYCIAHAD